MRLTEEQAKALSIIKWEYYCLDSMGDYKPSISESVSLIRALSYCDFFRSDSDFDFESNKKRLGMFDFLKSEQVECLANSPMSAMECLLDYLPRLVTLKGCLLSSLSEQSLQHLVYEGLLHARSNEHS